MLLRMISLTINYIYSLFAVSALYGYRNGEQPHCWRLLNFQEANILKSLTVKYNWGIPRSPEGDI